MCSVPTACVRAPTGSRGFPSALLLSLVVLSPVATGCAWIAVDDAELERTIAEAREAIQAGEPRRAVERLDDAARRRRDSIVVREALVDACLAAGTIESRRVANRALRQLVELDPAEPEYRYELGLLLFDRRFDRDAQRELRRVVTMRPDHAGAYVALGDLYRSRWRRWYNQDDLPLSREYYSRAAQLSPDDAGIGRRHVEALLQEGDAEAALRALEAGGDRWPEDGHTLALRATCLAALGRYGEAEAVFERAIDRMAPDQRRPFTDLDLVLDPYERARLGDLPPDDRADVVRGFWKRLDPTPTTRVNERRVEHYRRVTIADVLYARPRLGLRGDQTARGALYIRYGEPLWSGWTLDPALHHVYKLGDRKLDVVFQDIAGRFYLPFRLLPTAADMAAYAEPQSYTHEFGGDWIDHAVDVASFRGAGRLTRGEVYLSVPSATWRDAAGPDLEFDVVAFDPLWEEAARVEEALAAGAVLAVGRGGRALVHQVTLDLPPGPYHLATRVQSADGKLLGTATRDVEIPDLEVPRLALSGLELAFAVGGAGPPRFRKGGVAVLPNPTRVFERGELLHVYFEIYGLALAGGRGRYELRYRIRPAPRHGGSIFGRLIDLMRARTFIEARIEEASVTATATRYLGIDLEDLPTDRYDLTIAVTDLATGATARRSVQFERVAPRSGDEPRSTGS